MNSKKKPAVKSESTKPKKRIAQVASPQPGFPLDGAQRNLAEGALQDTNEYAENLIGTAKTNKEKRGAKLAVANKELVFKITEHEQAEETIRSLARFPSENPNPVLRIARDGNLLYGNPAAFTLLKKWKLRVGKPAPEVLKNLTNEALETETTKTVDIPCGDRIFSISIAHAPEGEYINLYARDVTERIRADQQLIEREALLNEVGVIAKVGGWEMDITTGKATWSKGTYDIVEIDYNKPVPGLHEHVGYYLPEYREMIESKMNALIETKQPMKFEAVLKTAKGNIKWCQALGEAVVKDGKLIKLRGTFQDITERKRAEKELHESEVLFSTAFHASPIGISITRLADGQYIDVNEGFLDLFGYTREEALSNTSLQLQTWAFPEDRDRVVKLLRDQGRALNIEAKFRRKSGESWTGQFSANVIKIAGEQQILVHLQNITERKQAEEQIRQLNAELESTVEKRTAQLSETLDLNQKMIEASSIGIFACRADGPCIIANPAMGRISGAPVEKMLQLNFRELKNWKENGLFDMAEAVLATGRQQRSESHLTTTFGRDVWLDYYFTTFTSNGWLHFLMLVDDITERKLAEQALQLRNAQVEAANQELEAFSYSISHDLRSPLRAMDGFSRILLEEYASQLPAEAQRYLGLVRDNAKQMGHLIEDLLAFSRLSRLPLNKQTVAMAEVVQRALAELSAEQQGRDVEVTIGDLPDCEADPALLKQVWVNLLSNAIKFTRKRKDAHIEIGAKQTGAECIYFIKDNGVGFDMQYVDKLFGVFQRLHRSEEYEGTGVGLAIVQRIVHRHGGGAWAEAEVDKGATFYFALGGGTL